MQQQQQAFPIYSGNFQSHHPRPQQQSLPPPQQFTNTPYRPSPVLPQTNYSTQQQQQQPSRKIYACKEQGCTEYFDQPTALRHHQKVAHGNEENQAKIAGQNKPYLCPFPECGKSFTQYGNLKTHSRKHTGERPYHCKYEGCDKAFTQLGNLKTHEKIHWPVKPFMCTYPGCGKGFTQRGNLKVECAISSSKMRESTQHDPNRHTKQKYTK